jgi:hypothetical protein
MLFGQLYRSLVKVAHFFMITTDDFGSQVAHFFVITKGLFGSLLDYHSQDDDGSKVQCPGL